MSVKKWLEKNCTGLTGKRVVVTGATGGLGREICSVLAKLGADIILACRNEQLADELKESLLAESPEIKVDFVPLDLASLDSVKNCIKILKKYNGIDILINNAGVYNVPLKTLDSGYNNIFQINFLYTYYLTKELLSELEKKDNSVCITLGSVAHNYSKIDEKDIDFSTRKKPSKIYGNSKRFLMFSLYDIFENSSVRLAIVHPGVTLTNMTNHYPKAINWLVKIGIKLVFPSPQKAVLSVFAGINQETQKPYWIGPGIFNVWGFPKLSKLTTCAAQEMDTISKIAEDLYVNIK